MRELQQPSSFRRSVGESTTHLGMAMRLCKHNAPATWVTSCMAQMLCRLPRCTLVLLLPKAATSSLLL